MLSQLTGLLVLETEADYRRFGIERNALADITVGERGIEVLRRRAEDLVVARAEVTTKRRAATAKKMTLSGDGSALGDWESEEKDEQGSAEGGMPAGVPGGVLGGMVGGTVGYGGGQGAAAPDSRSSEVERAMLDPAAAAVHEPPPRANAYSGRYGELMRMLARKQIDAALSDARAWVAKHRATCWRWSPSATRTKPRAISLQLHAPMDR